MSAPDEAMSHVRFGIMDDGTCFIMQAHEDGEVVAIYFADMCAFREMLLHVIKNFNIAVDRLPDVFPGAIHHGQKIIVHEGSVQ